MSALCPKLVHSHLPFVVKLAREYRHPGVPFEDLINEGNVGLVEAARRFEASRGIRFTTYAAWWIRKYMLKALRERSDDSIADPGSHSPEQHAVRRDLEQHLERALSSLSARAWRVLRDRFGLDGDRPLTLKEVGVREGVSRERVRQIELEALRRLRTVLTRRRCLAPPAGLSLASPQGGRLPSRPPGGQTNGGLHSPDPPEVQVPPGQSVLTMT